MNLLSLNCGGLGNPDTVRALCALVQREAPAMIFLCETKLCGREMRRVREKLEGYYGLEVDSMGRSGGLAFLWKKDIECIFVSISVHYIYFTVCEGDKNWRVTGFYGWPSVSERHLSWELLRVLKGQMDLPWIGDANRQSMLDRAMCNEPWLDMFSYATLHHLDREWSDHAPIKLILDKRSTEAVTKGGFKFEQIWLGEEGCEDAVQRRESAESNVRKRKKIVAKIGDLSRQEELYWRQRSRALWLKDGDRYTKFFHNKAGERKRKNFIGILIDDAGVERVGGEAVSKVANDYFVELFTTSNPINFEDVLNGLEGRVTDQMNGYLTADYTEDDIVEALNQMHSLKTPGPDGMNGLFFQSYWHLVGSGVVTTVLEILRGERSSAESAFTPDRLITDNILIAFEVFHHMKNARQLDGHMAIKLDMAKAYDRVE
ncbi:uncharacterized protein LOC141590463 [Silene latifolia]|uniref:uncharacterized protein LOC141590463 n=1 Tax=Silene latifolia TaxID=37657 RepID=UPI003D783A73